MAKDSAELPVLLLVPETRNDRRSLQQRHGVSHADAD